MYFPVTHIALFFFLGVSDISFVSTSLFTARVLEVEDWARTGVYAPQSGLRILNPSES